MKDSLEQFKKDFMTWSGFEIQSDNGEDMQKEVDQRLYDLECELFGQAKGFRKRIVELFPDEELDF